MVPAGDTMPSRQGTSIGGARIGVIEVEGCGMRPPFEQWRQVDNGGVPEGEDPKQSWSICWLGR